MTNRITGGVELLDHNYCQKTEESSLIQANMGESITVDNEKRNAR